MPEEFTSILDSIAAQGWATQANFLEEEVLNNLLEECKAIQIEGALKKAGIGKGEGQRIVNEIRGDAIYWFDENHLSPPQSLFYNKINQLKQVINQDFFLGLKEFECHLAVYPSGSFYKRHVDRFHNTNNRQISCILYLNKNWEEAHGGQLRIYMDNNGQETSHDIQPQWGTFACFRSDIAHEVLPTTKERYSITGWLKN